MCIAYLALGTDPALPLLIAANRDESHARPTRPCAPWSKYPDIIGGLDLQAGGTWFAVSKDGRFALVTNYRDLAPATGLEKSRGALCSHFLQNTSISAKDYLDQVATNSHNYQGFNLLVGEWQSNTQQFNCYYYSNRSGQAPIPLTPGHYVLSNHLLNTPWPKSQRLLNQLRQVVQNQKTNDIDAIYTILQDEQKATDHELPATGLDLERERLLSSPFIISPYYGTRSSAIWTVAKDGYSFLHECSYNPQGIETERHSWPLFLNSTLYSSLNQS